MVKLAEDPLVELARVLTRARYIHSLRGRYLVFGADAAAKALDYDTALTTLGDGDTGTFDVIDPEQVEQGLRVYELAKAPGNPFTDRISLGRAPNCDLVLGDRSVSKLHAHFRDRDGVLHVSDVGSQNGTRVNGVRIEPHVQVAVQLGDVLKFGNPSACIMDAGMLWDAVRKA